MSWKSTSIRHRICIHLTLLTSVEGFFHLYFMVYLREKSSLLKGYCNIILNSWETEIGYTWSSCFTVSFLESCHMKNILGKLFKIYRHSDEMLALLTGGITVHEANCQTNSSSNCLTMCDVYNRSTWCIWVYLQM